MRDGRGRPSRIRSLTGWSNNSISLAILLGILLVPLQAINRLHLHDDKTEGISPKLEQVTNLNHSIPGPSAKTIDRDSRRCSSAAKSLADKNINLLTLDFDLTIIDMHTEGVWGGSSEVLRRHVRPVFECLLNSAMDEGIRIGVVTFSEQKEVISSVMAAAFSRSGYMPIEAKCCGELHGKNRHIDAAIQDMNSHDERRARSSKETTLLIDDDGRNIDLARKGGYKALQFYPNADPWQIIEAMKSFS